MGVLNVLTYSGTGGPPVWVQDMGALSTHDLSPRGDTCPIRERNSKDAAKEEHGRGVDLPALNRNP